MAYEKQTWANGDVITAPKLNNIEGGVKDMNSSYEKQTWVTGEVITADKLNHIEDGIVNGGSGGGGSTYAPSNTGVTLRDYDGTVLGYYTNEEFDALTELPNPPAPQGLVATGWTATLEEAKASLAENGVVVLGRMYETASGATEIDIVLPEERKFPTLGIGLNGTATIDWGDGSAEDTLTGASLSSIAKKQHNYTSGGSYTIKINIISGEINLYGYENSSYSNYSSRLLHNSTNWYSGVYANSIKAVRLGRNVVSIGARAFNYCYGLESITIPNSVASIGIYAFSRCCNLVSVVIPGSVTSFGEGAFADCTALESVVMPAGLTEQIGNNTLNGCYTLTSVLVPESVTSIGTSSFQYCYSLVSVVLPSSVTYIGDFAFGGCTSLSSLKFESAIPPTANSSSSFGIPNDCIIKVPTGSLSAYTSARNYPDSSTYTYVEY